MLSKDIPSRRKDPEKKMLLFMSGRIFCRVIDKIRLYKINLRLAILRRRMFSYPPAAPRVERCLGYRVRFRYGADFYASFRDIIINRSYHFHAQRPDPLIIDCGSNIGFSAIYFKHAYPQSRIIGFEPDPAVFPLLKENIERNGLSGIRLVQAALAAQEGTLVFYSDGRCGSSLAKHMPGSMPEGWTEHKVGCVRLRDYLTEPVDFLKVNIEGAEWEVLADSEDRLRQVREIVVEYHHFPGLARTLHKILELLHRQGFEYLINDFDSESNHAVRPPFKLTPESRYYLLIYAKRID
ncbi:MAG: FkbM family methyltransferase [Candidatus Omnitrophica bacterium]|nr:FkbM family methyltransferase [Candidatus Omnitrophota bacterium]